MVYAKLIDECVEKLDCKFDGAVAVQNKRIESK